MTRPAFAMLVAIAATTGLVPVHAEARTNARHTVTNSVSYDDLDLGTPKGLATLDRRLSDAVFELCGKSGIYNRGGIDEYNDLHRCLIEARASAKQGRALAVARYKSSSRNHSRIRRK